MRNKYVPKLLHSVLHGSLSSPKRFRDTLLKGPTESHQRTVLCALAGAAEVELVLQARFEDLAAHVPHIVSGGVPFCVHELCSRQR